MSKRFGRNQRRKMREQIASLDAENTSMGTKIIYDGYELTKANRTIQNLSLKLMQAEKQYMSLVTTVSHGVGFSSPPPIHMAAKCSKCGAETLLPEGLQ